MNRKFLVSEIFEQSLIKYLENLKSGNLSNNCSNYENIIECLIFIYGDLDFINPNITKDTKALIDNLSKFGYLKNDIYNFFESFDRYDLFDILSGKCALHMVEHSPKGKMEEDN